LDNAANPNVQDIYGSSALHPAVCRKDSYEIAKLLLSFEWIHINIKNSYGDTPLHRALEIKDFKFVKALFDSQLEKIDFNIKNKKGELLLHLAGKCKDIDVLKVLVESSDCNAKAQYQETALMRAAEENNSAMVQLLVDKGINVNDKSYFKKTALTFAAKNGCTDVVKILVGIDSLDVNVKCIDLSSFRREFKKNALHLAVQNGHIDVVKLLLGRKDLDVNENYQVVQSEFSDTSPQSAFEIAVANKNIEIIKELLKDDRLNIEDLYIGGELSWALSKNAEIKQLIEDRIKLNRQNAEKKELVPEAEVETKESFLPYDSADKYEDLLGLNDGEKD
jgi:ankyrin repeat protein